MCTPCLIKSLGVKKKCNLYIQCTPVFDLSVLCTIRQHQVRLWLDAGKVTSHYLNNNNNPIQWHINASSHLSELSIKAHYRPYLVRRHIRVCAVWIINQTALNNHDVIAIPTRWSHNLNGQGQLATDSLISTTGRCEFNMSVDNVKSPKIMLPMISVSVHCIPIVVCCDPRPFATCAPIYVGLAAVPICGSCYETCEWLNSQQPCYETCEWLNSQQPCIMAGCKPATQRLNTNTADGNVPKRRKTDKTVSHTVSDTSWLYVDVFT